MLIAIQSDIVQLLCGHPHNQNDQTQETVISCLCQCFCAGICHPVDSSRWVAFYIFIVKTNSNAHVRGAVS